MTTVQGFVKNKLGDAVGNVSLTFVNTQTEEAKFVMSRDSDGAYEAALSPGDYVWVAVKEGYGGYSESVAIPADDSQPFSRVIVLEEDGLVMTSPGWSPPVTEVGVDELIKELTTEEKHSIEPRIDAKEAKQAIGLFSVANILMGGKGEFQVGSETKIDVLGILNLFYGLQDKSLVNRITVGNSELLWERMEGFELPELAKEFDSLQSDIGFILKEAKRQFNLGTNNNVPANTRFPTIFKRYVELGSDSLISINLKKADDTEFFDKDKLEKAYDVLKDLKEVIIEIVRSLSKYGTTATVRVNREWAEFEEKALEVLAEVARHRVSEDQDEQNTWSIVADLTNQNRDQIVPYVALGLHGATLLNIALELYQDENFKTEDFSSPNLVQFFQPEGDPKDFWTTKIRTAARFVKRYPLPNWGA